MKEKLYKYFKWLNYVVFIALLCFGAYKLTLAIILAKEEKKPAAQLVLSDYIKNNSFSTQKDKKTTYFYGRDVNNYVWYNGRLWQIMKHNQNNITLVTADLQSSIAWGEETQFSNSGLDKWLNHDYFYQTITDLTALTSNFELSLIDERDYLKTGGKSGFLNTGDTYYILNDKELKYVDEVGNVTPTTNGNLGLGIKPTLVIRDNVIITGGNGIKDDPLLIGKSLDLTNKAINYANVGSYINYDNGLWRIIDNRNNIKLVSDMPLLEKEENLLSAYGTINDFSKSDVLKLLTKKLNNDDLIEFTYSKINYGSDNNFNYQLDLDEKSTTKYGLLQVGELFTGPLYQTPYFLMTKGEGEKSIMTIQANGILFADDISTKAATRPVIKINKDLTITDGNGTLNHPYIIK